MAHQSMASISIFAISTQYFALGAEGPDQSDPYDPGRRCQQMNGLAGPVDLITLSGPDLGDSRDPGRKSKQMDDPRDPGARGAPLRYKRFARKDPGDPRDPGQANGPMRRARRAGRVSRPPYCRPNMDDFEITGGRGSGGLVQGLGGGLGGL